MRGTQTHGRSGRSGRGGRWRTWTTPAAGTQIFAWGSGSLNNGGEQIQLSKPGDVDAMGTRHYIRADRVVYNAGAVNMTAPETNDQPLTFGMGLLLLVLFAVGEGGGGGCDEACGEAEGCVAEGAEPPGSGGVVRECADGVGKAFDEAEEVCQHCGGADDGGGKQRREGMLFEKRHHDVDGGAGEGD